MPSKLNWQPWIGTVLMLIMGSVGWIYAAGAKRGADDAEIRSLKSAVSSLETTAKTDIQQLKQNQSNLMALVQAVSAKLDVTTAEQRILHHDQIYRLPPTPSATVTVSPSPTGPKQEGSATLR